MIQTDGRFAKIVDLINGKSPFQKKKLELYLESRDKRFWELAEDFAMGYEKFLRSESLNLEYLASSYLSLCRNVLMEQTKFLRTGRYSCGCRMQNQALYANRSEMMSYMCGLALSQFLWKNHYEMYNFFTALVSRYAAIADSYLEIGPGHGLFLVEILRNTQCWNYKAVDVSPVSIEISEKITRLMSDKGDKVTFERADILDYPVSGAKFDLITMGEVVEHIEDPVSLLKKVGSLLSDHGRLFMTTCSNCPAVDHIYLFNDVEEIRQMIYNSGFKIEEELVLQVEDLPSCGFKGGITGHNYAAVIRL